MNISLRRPEASRDATASLAIVDCDIHPAYRTAADLHPFLPARWREHMLLFSTDYPHWHFDDEDVLPDGLPEDTVRRLLIDNPLEAYPRLRDGVVADSGVLRDNAAAGQEAMR